MQDINVFKAKADTLVSYLANVGLPLKHTNALEALSRLEGYRNWSTLRAALGNTPKLSSGVPTLRQALTACVRWLGSAPIDELEALECAIGDSPAALALEALEHAGEDDALKRLRSQNEALVAALQKAHGFLDYIGNDPNVISGDNLTEWEGLRPELSAVLAQQSGDPASPWTMGDVRMSDAQYLQVKGNRCPSCGSREIDAGAVEADDSAVVRANRCEDCGAEWNEHYALKGLDAFTPGELRQDVIEGLVEDVRDRAQKYEFRITGRLNARTLLLELAVEQGVTLTQAELTRAIDNLV
ncbi:glyoxalase superfamily protein [Burkholderia cenocepacia]|uniref:glyoxalase superfamily protein n=1 Tax=Burkholderia cenocepacia TaxID=95486 RepID=UPI000761F663|nr:glyoxalase superfamily protein [Burkholderia cenocepacia]KWU23433.1 hypothetical protein AS149_37220 [Burkholderia cenocepacia]